MGEKPTGNARAISFRHPPIVRMTNTYIEGGSGTFEDLIADVKLGVYALEMMGGQTFLENFSFSAAYGYMIRDGQVAEMVKGIVLAGNLFKSLQSIDRLAGDFRWNQLGGGCGKGGQSPLPVTEGAPHVRFADQQLGEAHVRRALGHRQRRLAPLAAPAADLVEAEIARQPVDALQRLEEVPRQHDVLHHLGHLAVADHVPVRGREAEVLEEGLAADHLDARTRRA